MPLSSTQIWLRENTRFYSNSHVVYADADALLARFPPIRPKTDVYSLAHLLLQTHPPPHPLPHSLRRRKNPAASLSSRHPPRHLPSGDLQHPNRNLAHSRLSKGTPDCLRCSYPDRAHPLQPIYRPQRSLQYRVHSELAAQERGMRLSSSHTSILIHIHSRVAASSVS